eukprot:g6959.t1
MEAFSLDVDKGILALTFNEAMSNAADDVDWAGVSLRTHVNGLEGFGVTLWNTQGEQGWGTAASMDDGLTLAVDLHPIDLDDMKASHIGHNSSFTWLTLRAGAFVALDEGDGNEPIYGTQVVGHAGASVSELVEDTTSPTLDRFTLGSGGRELVLYFSEGVAALSALKPSALSLSLVYTDSGDAGLLTTIPSASLLCSSVELGRRQGSSRSASRREILLRLDEPCAATDAANSSSSATTSTGMAEDVAEGTSLQDGIDAATTAEAFVGGYPSDWSKLVAEGVLLEDDDGGSTMRRETEGVSLFLNATSDFVTDLSSSANPLVAVDDLEESFPGCTPCAFGTREVEECQQESDRVCEPCTECTEGEYESRECRTSGEDRECDTCLRCSMSAEVAEKCRNSRLVWQWQMDNCCETLAGEKVSCMDVALENLRISAMAGNWASETSLPPVARDGVVPRDRLIEVEFRAGAKTVFDDPRYVGQEGPTGGGMP